MAKRIVFTGGSGKAGKHVVPWLKAKGYDILNLDLKPLDCPGVNTLITDVTDSGQVFNALTMHHGFDGYDKGHAPSAPDAVVHFAAVPRVLIQPDNTTFTINTVSTYNVIEAAMKLGVRKVIIASSETTYGVCFAEGDKDYHHFPLYHVAILYPTRADLADALKRLVAGKVQLDGAADHGVSEALYLHDPDMNGIELYWDKPEAEWPRNADGSIAMTTQRLDLNDLINTKHGTESP